MAVEVVPAAAGEGVRRAAALVAAAGVVAVVDLAVAQAGAVGEQVAQGDLVGVAAAADVVQAADEAGGHDAAVDQPGVDAGRAKQPILGGRKIRAAVIGLTMLAMWNWVPTVIGRSLSSRAWPAAAAALRPRPGWG